jgi:hypothetical protein
MTANRANASINIFST